jgi:hypothetical protein
MVMGHENDKDCGQILQELKGAGFRVPTAGPAAEWHVSCLRFPMIFFDRRRLLCAAGTFAAALVASAALSSAQESSGPGKPEIKRSELKPVIMQYVDKMSEASKQSTGIEFTWVQKNELASSILKRMEAQDQYVFVDP